MVSAYVLVSVESGKNREVVSALRGVDGVKQAHTCWGQPDIPGVRFTDTHVVVPV